jgi:hypothetical protein
MGEGGSTSMMDAVSPCTLALARCAYLDQLLTIVCDLVVCVMLVLQVVGVYLDGLILLVRVCEDVMPFLTVRHTPCISSYEHNHRSYNCFVLYTTLILAPMPGP